MERTYKHGRCKGIKPNGEQCTVGSMKNSEYCGPHHTQSVKARKNVCTVEGCDNTPAKDEPICMPHIEEAYSLMEAETSNIKELEGADELHAEEAEQEEKVEYKDFIVAGTGSRSLQIADKEVKLAAKAYITKQFTALKEKYGDSLVIMSGMAEGFDALIAKVAIELDIRLHLVIPNKGYGRHYWMQKSVTGKNRYREFVDYTAAAEKVIYIMEDVYRSGGLSIQREGGVSGTTKGKARVHSNFLRNEYMVERANAFYVYNPKSRGTAHCFDLIVKANKPYKLVPTA